MAAYRELLAWQQRQNPPKPAPEVPDLDGSITHLPDVMTSTSLASSADGSTNNR